jgi:hypothetical protein
MILSGVLTCGRKKGEVLWTIVQGVVVEMMNDFVRGENAVKNFLHYETMFKDISHLYGIWVVRLVNISVAIANKVATMPFRIGGSCSRIALSRTEFPTRRRCLEFPFAVWACFIHSIIIDLGVI